MSTDRNIDFVMRTVEKRDIRFIRLWFTDILGNLKSFAISPEDLEVAFEEGIGFDGSAVNGFATLDESDLLAFPVAETFQALPWRPDESGVARVFCDIRTPKREHFEGDPRYCLERVFRAADERGYVMNVGPKLEFYYFDNDLVPNPVDHAGYFEMTPSDSANDLRRATILTLEKMSIPVTYSYHAHGPSQNGIELRHTEAVSCADNVMTARFVIKQLAYEEGMYASFMPKPLADCPGSCLSLHQSLLDHDGNNLFWEKKTDENPTHLSALCKSYIAGLIKYAPEYLLVTNPTVNSYKRLNSSADVPSHAGWGFRNRGALVRVPTYKPGKHLSTRLELRCPDPCANPYLAFAVTLAAGLKGVEEGLELPPEADATGIPQHEVADSTLLPRTLGEAIEAFEGSELMRETLGEHIFEFLLDAKKGEWHEFSSTVTDWEREHYYAGY